MLVSSFYLTALAGFTLSQGTFKSGRCVFSNYWHPF